MRSRIGLKTLGLSALVVGVMAISASAAQASQWMVAGANLAAGAESANVNASLVNNDSTLLTTIGGLAVSILCTAGNFENIKLKGTETTTNGKVVFTGCEVYKTSNGEALGCNVHTSGSPAGTIKTTEGHGLLELHGGTPGEPVTLVIPNNAESRFATLLTEECALPEVVPVFGSLALKDSEGKGEVEQAFHVVQELPALSHLYVISDTAEHASILDGKAKVILVGGANFSGLKE